MSSLEEAGKDNHVDQHGLEEIGTTEVELDSAVDDGTEVLVYDEELGQYQRYFCVQQNPSDSAVVIQQVEEGQPQGDFDHHIVDNDDDTYIIQDAEQSFLAAGDQHNAEEGDDKAKPVVLSSSSSSFIAGLQPGTLIQCNRCLATYLAEDFESHFVEAHPEAVDERPGPQPAADPATGTGTGNNYKVCSLCDRACRSKQDFLDHFKTDHSGVKLGCPKCPQTYHSPELLNLHFKHFHMKDVDQGQEVVATKRARVMVKCDYCDGIVENIEDHLIAVHDLDPAIVVSLMENLNPQPMVISFNGETSVVPRLLDKPFSGPFVDNGAKRKPANLGASNKGKGKAEVSLHCDICTKDFRSQREFTNHRRRKDFCRPPAKAASADSETVRAKPVIRRIGIIRKGITIKRN